MSSPAARTAFLLSVLWLGCALPAAAHRVDEYLQAARLSVERDRIAVELGLTPGIEVAPLVFSWIDDNRDGRISRNEEEAYAQRLLDAIELSVDGQPVHVVPEDLHFPDYREMSLGVGTIRIRLTGKLPAVAAGDHRLMYRNVHQAEWSVYLANTLLPDDDRIQIVAQHRDRLQRELFVDYRFLPGSQAPSMAGLPLVFVLVLGFGATAAWRWKAWNCRRAHNP